MRPLRAAFPLKTQLCFARSYDRAHRAANPDQSVTRIRIARLAPERRREDVDGPEAPAFALKLLVDGAAGSGREGLDCEAIFPEAASGEKAYLWCRSTCNRGRVDITPLGADRISLSLGGTVMGRFVPDAIGVGRSCDADRGVQWIGDRSGDRVFVLERAPLGDCR